MGQILFLVPRRDCLPGDPLSRVYLAGMEGVPWRSSCHWLPAETTEQRGVLVIQRDEDEAGRVFCPWHAPSVGEIQLATGSLVERAQTYNLPVELARGLLSDLRNQSSDWELLGLKIPAEFEPLMREATDRFIAAVTSAADEQHAADEASAAIQLGLEGVDLLLDAYVEQAIHVRHQTTPQLPTLLGVSMGAESVEPDEAVISGATNLVALAVSWRELEAVAGTFCWDVIDRQLEWCTHRGLQVLCGPLLRLDARCVPDWLRESRDDFPQLQAHLAKILGAVVARYRGRVQSWNCAARMNVPGLLPLNEEQRLRLIVTAVDVVHRGDPQTPLMVSFDQPWGEYLAQDAMDLAPLHFADSLVRADLGLASIGLEINVGYWPGGTLPRHRLEFSRMLDRWASLGLPLTVFLSSPGCGAAATAAGNESPPRRPLPAFLDGPTLAKQRVWAEQLLALLLAKPYIRTIVWNQLSDAEPQEFSHGGLFDAQQQPKPVSAALATLKQQHLS